MASDLSSMTPRSRRAVIAAGLGSLAALVAASLGRPQSAAAANGDAITLGGTFTGTTQTSLTNTGSGAGFYAAGNDYGLVGYTHSTSANYQGVLGSAQASTGGAVGVAGTAYNDSGTGVWGLADAAGATGVWAASNAGTALKVTGKARFSRSGRASVAANKTYADVTVPGGLGSGANVLATLQALRPGVYVAAVRINYPTAGKARIYLNKVASTTKSTPVAWFVFG